MNRLSRNGTCWEGRRSGESGVNGAGKAGMLVMNLVRMGQECW